MVWIFIDHDVVAVPEPIAAIDNVVWGDAEEEASKPETARSAALNPEDMAFAKTAPEASVGPRAIQVVVGIIPARIMSNPPVVGVDVGHVRMSRFVFEVVILRRRTLVCPAWRGPMCRNVPVADFVAIVVPFLSLLRTHAGK